MLVSHIRISPKTRYGSAIVIEPDKRVITLVALKNADNAIRISWAVKSPYDSWNRKHGIALAVAKATVKDFPQGKMPECVIKVMPKFLARAAVYFKIPIEDIANNCLMGHPGYYFVKQMIKSAYVHLEERARAKAEKERIERSVAHRVAPSEHLANTCL